MTGLFDGIQYGNNMSILFLADTDRSCTNPIRTSHEEYVKKYFENVTNGQIVDGLTSFYEDYRNRRILLTDAIWAVTSGISGMSKEKMERFVEDMRRAN